MGTMKEEIPQLSGPWGSAFFNDLEQAVFRYAPAHPSERLSAGMPPLCIHRFGNAGMAVLASGDGRMLPVMSCGGRLVSLCGDVFHPGPLAGNRLFVVEGGLVRPVVGPDHPLCERSDMLLAPMLLTASGVESDVTTPDLAVRCRVSVPLEGMPTLLLWMQVSNHSQGTRWVTLWNLWNFLPVILEAQLLDKAPLARRLAAALGIGQRDRVDNSYFTATCEGSGARVQVAVDWNGEVAETRWKGVRPLTLPPIQAVALTRNVELGTAGIPQQLAAVLSTESTRGREPGGAEALLAVRAAFEVRSGEQQVAAVAIHPAEWDRAKPGLKRLMPLALHMENEGILHRKRLAGSTERVRLGQREIDRWQGSWQAALTGALGLRSVDGPGEMGFPLSAGISRSERPQSVREQAVAALSLAFNHPALCAPLLSGLAIQVVEAVEAFHGVQGKSTRIVEDVAWLLWALAESEAVLGWSSGRNVPVDLPAVMSSVVSLLGLKEIRGPHGLVTTAWCDPCDVPHSGHRGAARESGDVETVAGSAMLMVACSAAARQFGSHVPDAAEELARLGLLLRSSMDALAGPDGALPCWLLGNIPVGSGELRPVQLAWLLADSDCPERVRSNALEAARRMVAGGRGGPLADLVDPDPSAPPGRVDLVDNALLIAALARTEPQLALSLFEAIQPDAFLRERPGDWPAIFLPGAVLEPLPPPQSRAAATAGESWNVALRAADGRGCAAVHLARTLIGGVRGIPGGLRICIDLLDRLSVRWPVLSLLRTGDRIHGLWQGSAAERTIVLDSTLPGEIRRWRIFKGTPGPDVGTGGAIVFQIKAGESWGIELA